MNKTYIEASKYSETRYNIKWFVSEDIEPVNDYVKHH